MLILHANVIAYLTGALFSALAAVYAFRMRSAPGGRWLFAMLISTTIWPIAEAYDYSATSLDVHIAWGQLSYFGATTAAVFYFLFALEYCGIVRRVTPALASWLLVIPILSIIAAYSNDLHHLVWPSFSIDPTDPTLITYGHGPVYWAVTVYSLGIGLLGSTFLVRLAARVRGIYRVQGVATILAATFPWGAELAYSIAPEHYPGFDPAITLGVSGALLAVSMAGFRLLDLVPVPREILIEEMAEGVVVIDECDRMLEINPAAAHLLGLPEAIKPGTEVSGLVAEWPEDSRAQLAAIRAAGADSSGTIVAPSGRYIGVERGTLAGSARGRRRDLFLLRDVTEQVEADRELQKAYADLQQRMHEIQELQHDLQEQALRDPLTGLHNRRYLSEALERELGRAKREEYPVSLVMLDVDHFKNINDRCGHSGGDDVLRVLGAELRAHTRLGDTACRYGGDEFVILLPNTSTDDAAARADRWRRSLDEAMVECVEGECRPSVSLGVATYPDHATSIESLFAAADAAVYASKAAGRDRVTAAATPHRSRLRAVE